MNIKSINQHDQHPYRCQKHRIDKRVEQLLYIQTRLLKLIKQSARLPIFKLFVRQRKSMTNSLCIELRANSLTHQTDIIVLKCFRHSRDTGSQNTDKQKSSYSFHIAQLSKLSYLCCIVINQQTKNLRTYQGKKLINNSK